MRGTGHLALPARQTAHVAPAQGADVQKIQHPLDLGMVLGQDAQAAALHAGQQDGFVDSQHWPGAVVLRHIGEETRCRRALDPDRAGAAHEPEDPPEQRRFPCPVRSQQRDQLPAMQRGRGDSGQHLATAICGRHVLQGQAYHDAALRFRMR